jgi:hypothetical protein
MSLDPNKDSDERQNAPYQRQPVVRERARLCFSSPENFNEMPNKHHRPDCSDNYSDNFHFISVRQLAVAPVL